MATSKGAREIGAPFELRVVAAYYSIESSTALAVAFTSLPMPRTVFAQDARKRAHTIAAKGARRAIFMNCVSQCENAQVNARGP